MSSTDRDGFIDAYIEQVLEHGEAPASVWKFCKHLDVPEADFYKHFASLQALEGAIWAQLATRTIETLHADEDYAGYSTREKWLAFSFTYLENLKAYRSFALERFPRAESCLCSGRLKKLEAAISEFAEEVIEAGKEEGTIADRGPLLQAYPKAFFGHIIWISHFFLDDESENFERTDAAIEKSVNLAFDLVGNQVLDNIVDFARFILGSPAR